MKWYSVTIGEPLVESVGDAAVGAVYDGWVEATHTSVALLDAVASRDA